MKHITLLAIFAGLFACGKDDNPTPKLIMDSQLVDTWASISSSEIMIISPDGTVSSSICGSYKITELTQDTLATCIAGASPGPGVTVISCGYGTIKVTGATGSNGCLSIGTHSCHYLISSTSGTDYLGYRCDGGTVIRYTRQ